MGHGQRQPVGYVRAGGLYPTRVTEPLIELMQRV